MYIFYNITHWVEWKEKHRKTILFVPNFRKLRRYSNYSLVAQTCFFLTLNLAMYILVYINFENFCNFFEQSWVDFDFTSGYYEQLLIIFQNFIAKSNYVNFIFKFKVWGFLLFLYYVNSCFLITYLRNTRNFLIF